MPRRRDSVPLFYKGRHKRPRGLNRVDIRKVTFFAIMVALLGMAGWLYLIQTSQVASYASGYTQMIQALDFHLGPSYEVIVTGKPDAQDTRRMVEALQKEFIPNKVVLLRPPGDGHEITTIARFTATQTGIDDLATAYVCQDYACRTPTTDIEEMLNSLGM